MIMTLAPKPNILMCPPDLHPDMELLMRVVPMPSDANGNGDIFGGWIMAQVDLAGSILPGIVSRGRIATVAVNQFTFKQAVSVGDVVSLYGRIEKIGRTSISVHMEAWAERNPSDPSCSKSPRPTSPTSPSTWQASHGPSRGDPGRRGRDLRHTPIQSRTELVSDSKRYDCQETPHASPCFTC
jgi:acyl-CoA thioesterase YciA